MRSSGRDPRTRRRSRMSYKLPEVGEIRSTTEMWKQRACDECGEPAVYEQTYLLKNARRNPDSSAYGKDDCSYCSDTNAWACKIHADMIRSNPPQGYEECSRFDLSKFSHRSGYWR